MTTTESAIAALKSDLEGLNAQIAELKQRHKSELEALRIQCAPLARAIAALSGVRKPMSDEAKAAIRAGLEKARAAKLASTSATGASSPAQVTAAPSAAKAITNTAVVAPGTKKDLANDKGPGRAS